MQSNHVSFIALLCVISVHAGLLAAVATSAPESTASDLAPPTIQGVLVMAKEQPAPPPPEPLPPPKTQPLPKPTKPTPPPKAPPSERAVKAPQAEPPPPVAAPVNTAPPEPARPAAIVPPRTEAGQLGNAAPAYPSLSRRLREQGTVVLEILIKADGSVGAIKLKHSSGFKRLDDAAIKAVRRWRYLPASQAGQFIDFWYEQPVEFHLR